MAKRLAEILSEQFDTGDPHSSKPKWYVRKINKKFYGRFRWNSGKQSFVRKGGSYSDKQAAQQAAKLSV